LKTNIIGTSVKKSLYASLSTTLLLVGSSSSLNAFEWGMTTGAQDFVVPNIVDDTPLDGISAGDSHTFGVNVGVYLNHTNKLGINVLAKAEALVDYDKDELDPDHIPVWFKFLVDFDGPIIALNDHNTLKWYVLMDNKQNTVSCIEREIRSHYGVGYDFAMGGFTFDINAFLGFYYIELDDDTPVNRGYTRQQTDDGEASNLMQIEMSYNLQESLLFYATLKHYSANSGFEKLETDYNALVSYKSDWLENGSSLNLSVEYSDYDFSRFYLPSVGLPIVPFDNDMLIQAYLKIPFN